MYKIVFYQNTKDENEVLAYINYLNQHNNKDSRIKLEKITAYMRLLQTNGLALGAPYIKHLCDNIWELRPLRDRIIFAHITNSTFLLLTCFMKETQKTPKREIDRAKKLLAEYMKKEDKENE